MDSIEIRAKIGGALLSFVGRLPLNFLYKVGGFAAWVMNKVLHYRKTMIYTNIARSFPGIFYDRVDEIATDYYKHLGDLVAETIWFGGCKGRPERLRKQNLYRYTNLDVLINARKDRGVICMKSHMGNWEVLGAIFEFCHDSDILEHLTKDDLFVAYRAMSNKVSDKIFYNNRCAVLEDYHGLVEDTKLLRHAIMHQAQKPVYVLAADQYPYKACHHVGTFLNQPTEGMLGGFGLAEKLGFAVLYCREERVGRGHYTMTFEVITENAAGQDPAALMRKYYDLLEADIRKDPANWLWSHRRWH